MHIYVAGWNMPGYLPEGDPLEFDNFADAKQYIIDTVKEWEDEEAVAEQEFKAEELCHAAEAINLQNEPFACMAGEYAVWVRVEDTPWPNPPCPHDEDDPAPM